MRKRSGGEGGTARRASAGSMAEKPRRVVRKWSPEEDLLMTELVQEHGTKHWGLIGNKLNGHRQAVPRALAQPVGPCHS